MSKVLSLDVEERFLKEGFRKTCFSLLEYNQYSGRFMWKVSTTNRVKPGDYAGYVDPQGYNLIPVCGRKWAAHRLAFLYMTGEFPKTEVDHVNGIRDDNRWENLRAANTIENRRNRKVGRNNTTGFKGVSYNKNVSRYIASIRDNYKAIFLGYYDTPEEAARAYDKKAVEIHGSYALLNFPDEVQKEYFYYLHYPKVSYALT